MRLVLHFAEKIDSPHREPLTFDNWPVALVALHTVPGAFKVVNETPLHTPGAVLAVIQSVDSGPLSVCCRGDDVGPFTKMYTSLGVDESAAVVRTLISGTHPECA